MCGRYTLNKTSDDVAKRFNIATKVPDIRLNFNVAPSQIMPVITEGDNGTRQIELMKWGIPRVLGKDFVKELINTRSDKAFGGFWRKTVQNHRCLIPATGFYEWKVATQEDTKVKQPYYIHPKDLELYAFAGIWSTWKNDDGKEIKVYSIMTTEPNKEMKDIHTRMPVILHKEEESSWIEPSNVDQESLEKLLFPSEDDRFEIYEVSRDVNSPRNNDPSLLKPVTA
jgi:putative SOS response-associated peptidase YedK